MVKVFGITAQNGARVVQGSLRIDLEKLQRALLDMGKPSVPDQPIRRRRTFLDAAIVLELRDDSEVIEL